MTDDPIAALATLIGGIHNGFRKIGFTLHAAVNPLSDNGASIIAEHNGVPLDKLPPLYRYASSSKMREWIEQLGALKAAGLPYRGNDGRFIRIV